MCLQCCSRRSGRVSVRAENWTGICGYCGKPSIHACGTCGQLHDVRCWSVAPLVFSALTKRLWTILASEIENTRSGASYLPCRARGTSRLARTADTGVFRRSGQPHTGRAFHRCSEPGCDFPQRESPIHKRTPSVSSDFPDWGWLQRSAVSTVVESTVDKQGNRTSGAFM